MLYLSYCKESSTSGKILAEKLGCKAFHTKKRKTYPVFEGGDIVINYGSSTLTTPHFVRVFNKPAGIYNVANKRRSRQLLSQANVPMPALYTSIRNIEKFPVIARPDYHTQGKEFWFCNNMTDARFAAMKGATHFIEYLRNTTELRIHIMASKPEPESWEDFLSIKASAKLPVEDKPHPVIKNFEGGYRFFSAAGRSGLSASKLDECRKVAKRASFVSGLHFVAVDMAVSYGNIAVFELNSSPALSNTREDAETTTADTYCKSIKRFLLEEEENNEETI